MTSDGPQAAFEASTASSRWTPTAPLTPMEKHFRAFLAQVTERHGYGPMLGQSHAPCGICRSIENARAFLDSPLTERETDVMDLLVAEPDLTREQVAHRLHLSPETVKHYLANARAKYDVSSTRAAVMRHQRIRWQTSPV